MAEDAGDVWRQDLIRGYVEDHIVRLLRRREEAAALLSEYEAEHGVITDVELAEALAVGPAQSDRGDVIVLDGRSWLATRSVARRWPTCAANQAGRAGSSSGPTR